MSNQAVNQLGAESVQPPLPCTSKASNLLPFYLTGDQTVSDQQMIELEAHLRNCARCQSELRLFISLMIEPVLSDARKSLEQLRTEAESIVTESCGTVFHQTDFEILKNISDGLCKIEVLGQEIPAGQPAEQFPDLWSKFIESLTNPEVRCSFGLRRKYFDFCTGSRRVNPAERQSIEQHSAQCGNCQELLGLWMAVIEMIQMFLEFAC